MVVVIFEFETDSAQQDRYFDLAAVLRDEVEKIDGFISVSYTHLTLPTNREV